MKSFRFSLEAVRIVRQRREQAALEKYGRALKAQVAARSQLVAVEWELGLGWERMRQAMAGAARAGDLAGIQNHCRLLEEQRTACLGALARAQRSLATATGELTAAKQQTEAVDKLRERQVLLHDRALQREEQKEIDEIAGRQSPLALMGPFTLQESWN